MPKKKETETQAAQSERFRKAVCAAIDAGELNPTEADDASERLASSQALGSGLIDQIQQMTVAALQRAQKKVWAHGREPSVDAPPVLEPSEHDLDLVVLAVEDGIVRDRRLALGAGWDGTQAAMPRMARACLNRSASSPLSAGRTLAPGRSGNIRATPLQSLIRPSGQKHDEGPAFAVADGLEPGVQAALGASDASGSEREKKTIR